MKRQMAKGSGSDKNIREGEGIYLVSCHLRKDVTNARRRVSEKFQTFSWVTHHLTLMKSYSL